MVLEFDSMRAVTTRTAGVAMLTAMMALGAMPAQSQTAGPPASPAATAPAATPEAPIRSTLKPAPAADADTSRPRQRLVTVFGTEECPKPTSPDEVVVCARLPDSEIYRIPAPIRQAERRVSPFQSNRNLLLGDASGGAGGSIGSCSVIGGGGMIGCSRKQVDDWAQDRANRMGTNEEIPEQ